MDHERPNPFENIRLHLPLTREMNKAFREFHQDFQRLLASGTKVLQFLGTLSADLDERFVVRKAPHASGDATAKCQKAWEELTHKVTECIADSEMYVGHILIGYEQFLTAGANNEIQDVSNKCMAEHAICELVVHFSTLLTAVHWTFNFPMCPCCDLKEPGQPHSAGCSLIALGRSLLSVNSEISTTEAVLALQYKNPRLTSHSLQLPHVPQYPYQVYFTGFKGLCIPRVPFNLNVYGCDNRPIHGPLSVVPPPMLTHNKHPQSEGYRGVSPLYPDSYGKHPLSTNEGSRILSSLDTHRMPQPEMRGPLPPPGVLNSMYRMPYMFPLEGQRRWSEAAAAELHAGHVDEGMIRRWSMPHEGRHESAGPSQFLHPPPPHHNLRRLKLPPHAYSSDRSRSITPEWQMGATVHTATGDGLVDALQLLSHWPTSQPSTTPSHSIHQGIAEVWPEEESHDPSRGVWAPVLMEAPAEQQIQVPRPINTVRPGHTIPEAPVREFELFGATDMLSCLRDVTSKK